MFNAISFSRVAIFSAILLFSFNVKGQNKLLLMNGYEITLRSFEEDLTTRTIRYSFEKELSGGRLKVITDEIDMERLFSLTFKDGKERIYYEQDSTDESYHTLDRARLYVYGSRDAQLHYKPKSSLVGGIIYGFVGGLVFSPFMSTTIAASSLVLPMARNAKIDQNHVEESSLELDRCVIINTDYREGYQKVAKHKRVQKNLMGAGMGLVGGLIIAKILDHNKVRLSINFSAKFGKI